MKFETACFDMDDEDEFEEGNEHERVFVDGECGKRDFLLQLVEDRLKERNVDGELLNFAFEPHVFEEEDA
jgi:hypothetical protein